ncbi:MAG: glucan biosynthesis protein G [Rhodothalassiaceae bacterium]
MNRITGTLRHLAATALLALLAEPVPAIGAEEEMPSGISAGLSFSHDALIAEAERRARLPAPVPAPLLPAWMRALDYDAYRKITFDRERSFLQPGKFSLQLFHPGFLFREPVSIAILEDGIVMPIPFDQTLFRYGKDVVPPPEAQSPSGFAGLRLHYPLNLPGVADELAVFQGASYFRLLGSGQAYGLSARGLALDVASGKGEEFPRFSAFWIERPESDATEIVLHALLESPSVTGAYRFLIEPGDHSIVEVAATLFFRAPVEKLAIAPLTSMFLMGEMKLRHFDDYRPEVHDSDGLLIHNGAGEWLWRPLANPRRLSVNAFTDRGPQGFGLFQRDGDQAHYEDLGAHYHRRPSYWIEPVGDWGAGHVELVEIPTDSETNDNIVAFWVPADPPTAGARRDYRWRMTAIDAGETPHRLARVAASRSGPAMAVAGKERPAPGARRFLLDYEGEAARYLAHRIGAIEPDLSARGGVAKAVSLEKNPETGGLRFVFDALPAPGATMDLRVTLRQSGEPVSEVWLFSFGAETIAP